MERKEKRLVAFIPARGGSKSIPLKNIQYFAGKPLIYWAIEAALGCERIERVYVATDSIEIANCVNKIDSDKLTVISRSEETATDTASSESALIEFCENYSFDHVMFIQATSPLLTSNDLEKAWLSYVQGGFSSLLSVVRQKRFIWNCNVDGAYQSVNYNIERRPRRQDFDGFLVENGAFYLSSRSMILSSGCRLSGRIGVYECPEESYYEIDEPSDWIIAENILKAKLSHDSDTNNKAITSKLDAVKMLVLDVDGVLTDAGMYYTEFGDETKKFNTRDGKGIELLRNIGIKSAIVTSETTKIVERRANKLKIDYLYQGVQNKREALMELSRKSGISLKNMAYIGDDVNDISAMEVVGISVCPLDAVAAVKARVDINLTCKGGNGAVREFCEILLATKQK